MAFAAGSAVTRTIQAVFEITPVFGVRIEAPRTTLGAVATQTDITIRMAGLTGHQRFASLPGMTDRPGVEIWCDRTLQVTGVALQGVVDASMNGIDIGIVKTEAETTPV